MAPITASTTSQLNVRRAELRFLTPAGFVVGDGVFINVANGFASGAVGGRGTAGATCGSNGAL